MPNSGTGIGRAGRSATRTGSPYPHHKPRWLVAKKGVGRAPDEQDAAPGDGRARPAAGDHRHIRNVRRGV